MPAKAPPSGPQVKKTLLQLGSQIRAQRKTLKVSTIGAAEAAGISRMTLNRIENGEPSVTLGAYLNVILALGLNLTLDGLKETFNCPELRLDSKIKLSNYPQLRKLAWQLKKTKEVTAQEALNIYERNWRHIELDEMKPEEREFVESLLHLFGKERLLV